MTDTDKLKASLLRERHLKLHLDALIRQSEQLNLILEFNRTYYNTPKEHLFTQNGFLSYTINENKDAMFIDEFFTSKEHRGGMTIARIYVKFRHLVKNSGVRRVYCEVQKDNKHFQLLKDMYIKLGFEYFNDKGDSLIYRMVL